MTDNPSIRALVEELGANAKAVRPVLAAASGEAKNRALGEMAKAILKTASEIEAANASDIEVGQAKGLSAAFIDRLHLNMERIEAMASGLEALQKLPDPVGRILEERQLENGLHLKKIAVPLGVIGVIFESRPNVAADAGALCLKAGNAVILRSGSDALASVAIIVQSLQAGLEAAGFPKEAIQYIPSKDRAAVGHLLEMNKYVDVIVPRGGKSLVSLVEEKSRIPVFSHLDGICHTYVDKSADLNKALKLVVNAKMRRTGICGATECLLVHRDVASEFLPRLEKELVALGCELRADARSLALLDHALPASERDWGYEFLDAILAIRQVANLEEAMAHIAHFGSGHTDAIVSEDPETLARFSEEVDSAIVMQNTSTQFADGYEFGLGAEIGISTGRLHARGPVGAAELTTYKYLVSSEGQIRS